MAVYGIQGQKIALTSEVIIGNGTTVPSNHIKHHIAILCHAINLL